MTRTLLHVCCALDWRPGGWTGRLGGQAGRLGGQTGRLGGRIRRLGGWTGRLGGVLEASWAVLGRKRWPTSPQVGSQSGAKIDKKSIQTSINFLMPLGIDIFRFFFDFWSRKPSHVGSKMHSKLKMLRHPKRL